MRVAICEDNEQWQCDLYDKIMKASGTEEIEIDIFDSGEEYLNKCKKGTEFYDLAFIDIELNPNSMSGINLIEELNVLSPNTLVVIATAYLQYAPQGYELNVFRFILKPYEINSIAKILSSAAAYKQHIKSQKVLLETYSMNVCINSNKILYFEAKQKGIVATTDEDKYYLKTSLQELEDQYGGLGFYRIHRTYIVNMERVKKVMGKEVLLDNGTSIGVSQRRMTSFKKALYQYLRTGGCR